MTNVERIRLSDVLGLCKKPHYVLGTTYSLSLAFFESVVRPFIGESELRRCLLISDVTGYQRALTEARALRGAGQDYLIVASPTGRTFHCKVWLVMDADTVTLLVGSGNLTQSGFIGNAELFDAIQFSKDQPPDRTLHTSITSFLSGLRTLWTGREHGTADLCADALHRMQRHLASFAAVENESTTVRFLHSLEQPLLEQLPRSPGASRLYVAAPYFGDSLTGLSALADRYSTAALSVFPAVHPGDTLDISPGELVKKYPKANVRALDLSPKKRDAFAHLKLYGLADKEGPGWIFCTSANCSHAAWMGTNIEAGLLRRMSRPELSTYFAVGDRDLPNTVREQEDAATGDQADISMTAVDSGVSLEITVDPSTARPLRAISVEIFAGSTTGRFSCKETFERSPVVSIGWTEFRPWRHPDGTVMCVTVVGRDANNRAVRGACFVENRHLLSADPGHRSANRGVLALLGQEGLPQLADIAAIFSLIGSAFHGRLVVPLDAAARKVLGSTDSQEDGEQTDSPKLPLWPPQEPPQTLRSGLSVTQLGHLHWCQKILAILVNARQNAPPETVKQGEADENEANGTVATDEQAPDDMLRQKETLQQHEGMRAIWDRAWSDYNRMTRQLERLVPNEQTAPNVWPVSLFVFLATMAVHRATWRISGELSTTQLVDQFLKLMLEKRPQDEDFCCPKYLRYTNEVFPPLADDLWKTFGIHPEPTLAAIILTLAVDQRRRMAPNNEYPGRWPPMLRQLGYTDTTLPPDLETRCVSTWRCYLRTDTSPETEVGFRNAFHAFWSKQDSAT